MSKNRNARKSDSKPAAKSKGHSFQTLTTNQEEEIRSHFESYMNPRDGAIEFDQLVDILRLMKQNPTDAELWEHITGEVTDDRMYTVDEVLDIIDSVGLKTMDEAFEEINNAFRSADTNGNGTISPEELWEFLQAQKQDIRRDEFDDVMADADLNANGVLDCNEFALFLSGSHQG